MKKAHIGSDFNDFLAEEGLLAECKAVALKRVRQTSQERKASQWATQLMEHVRAVLAVRPEADPDNVRHTLILLEQPPLERLKRSLMRGRALAQRK